MGMFPGEYKIKIMKNAEGIIKPSRRVPQTVLEKLKKRARYPFEKWYHQNSSRAQTVFEQYCS